MRYGSASGLQRKARKRGRSDEQVCVRVARDRSGHSELVQRVYTET